MSKSKAVNRVVRRKQRGFSLWEAGLALSLALGVMGFMAHSIQQTRSDTRSLAAADSLKEFNRFATAYLAKYRNEILKAADDGTDAAKYCVVKADPETGVGQVSANTTKKTCSIDISWLKYQKVLPSHYPETNPYNQRWVAIYRNVYADYDNNPVTPDTSQGDIEMLILGMENGGGEVNPSIDEIMLAASLAGGNAGIVPSKTVGDCAAGEVNPAERESCSVTGGWKVKLQDFID